MKQAPPDSRRQWSGAIRTLPISTLKKLQAQTLAEKERCEQELREAQERLTRGQVEYLEIYWGSWVT